jgi:hypothetical protein
MKINNGQNAHFLASMMDMVEQFALISLEIISINL